MENNIITLHPTKLVAVVVPEDAYDIQSWYHGIGFKHDNWEGEKDTNGFYHIHTGMMRWKDYSVLGTVTREGVLDFDPEPWVETFFKGHRRVHPNSIRGGTFIGYWDYFNQNAIEGVSATDSFLSLFPANGVYLKNPMGERPRFIHEAESETQAREIMDILYEWQSYQSKTLTQGSKFVILKPGK